MTDEARLIPAVIYNGKAAYDQVTLVLGKNPAFTDKRIASFFSRIGQEVKRYGGLDSGQVLQVLQEVGFVNEEIASYMNEELRGVQRIDVVCRRAREEMQRNMLYNITTQAQKELKTKELTAAQVAKGLSESTLKIQTLSPEEAPTTGEMAADTLKDLIERREGKIDEKGTRMYIPEIDRKLTLPFSGGQYVVIAGRPGQGKTALALGMAYEQAKQGYPTAFFSIEMSRRDIFYRLWARETGIPYVDIARGALSDTEVERVKRANEILSSMPFYLDDSAVQSISTIASKVHHWQSVTELAGMYVDYIQILTPEGDKNKSREQEVSEISRTFRVMSKHYSLTAFVLSQLNRAVDYRDKRKPQLSDLRESGSIEQDADMIFFVSRPELWIDGEAKREWINKAIIDLAKQRNGDVGDSVVSFYKPTMKFSANETIEEEEEKF